MTLDRMMSIERLDRPGALDLGSEWDELRAASSAEGPFTTWPWISAWLETLGEDADLEIHVARDPDSGELIGVAPFYVASTRRGGLPVGELRFVGSGIAAPDHLDLIIRDTAGPEVATSLWSQVQRHRRWHLLNLDGLAHDGHLSRVAMRRGSDRPAALIAPYLPLADDWETVEQRFSSRLRKNLGRYGRKLDREAAVTERLITDPHDLDATFDRLVEFHQAIRTGKGDPGVFAEPETTSFLRLAAHRMLAAGRLRMWRLDADGSAIAVILCMRAGDSVAFYTTGYDPDWSRYGPGRRIMARAIQGAVAEGASEFDFLRGDEAYKREWGTVPRTLETVRRPTSARGRALWAAGTLLRITRQALRSTD